MSRSPWHHQLQSSLRFPKDPPSLPPPPHPAELSFLAPKGWERWRKHARASSVSDPIQIQRSLRAVAGRPPSSRGALPARLPALPEKQSLLFLRGMLCQRPMRRTAGRPPPNSEGHYCRLLLGPSRGRTHCMLFSVGVNLIEGDFLLLLRRRFPALSPALVGRPLPQQEGDSEARRPHFTHFPQRGVICGNTLLWYCLWI